MGDLHEVLEAIAGGQTLYKHSGCDGYFPEEDLVEVRECSNENCGEVFNGTENGRNCESCNRPFSRVLTRKGCPDCVEEDECSEVSLDDIANELAEEEMDDEERKDFDVLLDNARKEQERKPTAPVFKTKSEHIRYLASKGMSRSAIAEELGVRYQVVRSALLSKVR